MRLRSLGRLLSALLLFLAIAPELFAQERIKVFMAPKPAGDPQGVDVAIVNFFNRAKKTLHGAFYDIREPKFVDALIAAKKRGVEVQLLVDNTTFFGKTPEGELDRLTRNPEIDRLLAAGVQIKDDKGRSAIMHNKFCIVDGRWVWTGSVNLTSSYAINTNNGVEVESLRLAAIYEREFDKKFVKQLFGPSAPSYAAEQTTSVGGTKLEVLYAPEDDPLSRILVLLNSARKSVHIMQFAFTSEEVTTILLTKFKAGVKVHGIFDHRLYRSTGPYGDFATLLKAGVPVQLYQGEGLFHHKVFIVDAGTPQAKVITGSQNASTNGNKRNDENILVIHSQQIADLYMAEFEKHLRENSQVGAEALYDKDPVAGLPFAGLDVMITANGASVKRLKVEYPARWPIDLASGVNVTFWRNGKNVTRQVGATFYEKSFFLNNPGLTATGADSLLEVKFRNLVAPGIPGTYNLYVSAASPESTDDFRPCRKQPTINVRPATDDEIHDAFRDAANDTASKEPRVMEAGVAFDALQDGIAMGLEEGDLSGAQRYVAYVEGLSAEQRQADGLVLRSRDLARALRSLAADAQAAALLARLETAVRGE